jgi:predicted hydrocarbon binding protein
MVVRKHISIEKKYVDKVRPFLARHDGNFSAAMREIIDLAVNPRIVLTHSEGVTFFDPPTADWLLRKTNGMIPEKEILFEIADPLLFNSVSRTLDYFNYKFRELGWGVEFILNFDSDTILTTATLTVKGENYLLIDLSVKLFSLYLASQKSLGIEAVYRRAKSIKLTYRLRESAEEAVSDINKHMGVMQELFSVIEKQPDFWRALVKKYKDSNYKTVAIHLNHFEDLLAKKTPIGEIGIELTTRRPIKDIPLDEFLNLIKGVYETSRIVESIDIEGDTVKILHSYRNPRAVDTLKKIFIHLLEINGHTYNARSTRNLIILRHMPEIGIKISELISNLKKSGRDFDRELIAFLTFVSGLKDAPDISDSIRALGYRMSKQILREYEKEHKLRGWDMKTFQEAFSAFDSKIGRMSEWKSLDGSICYTVKKCNLVHIGGSFNIDICQFSRGFFKGAIEYAFKNDAEVNVIKLLTHDDDRCEVCIRVQTSLP